MQVTKIGHCCLLIETKGVRILTDPGVFSTEQNELQNIDLILVTHEHSDHLHAESVQAILKKNPAAQVWGNASVGKKLSELGVKHQLFVHQMKSDFKGVSIEAFGEKHAVIFSSLPVFENTGFLVDNRLFFPGDAFTVPSKHVEILALPVEGPWMKLSEAIDYALKVKPKTCFPVHDARLALDRVGSNHTMVKSVLAQNKIEFVISEKSKPMLFEL